MSLQNVLTLASEIREHSQSVGLVIFSAKNSGDRAFRVARRGDSGRWAELVVVPSVHFVRGEDVLRL